MKAEVEQRDGSYVELEMGDPVCGEDFCDTCGDCIYCYSEDCFRVQGHPSRWVIYLSDAKHPDNQQKEL